MKIAIVGCGFVADYYLATLPLHPELELLGVTDRDPARSRHLAAFHSVPRYESLQAILDDDRVDMVLNLTNPRSHYEISKAALEAGKHVYSEKPLGMNMDEARELVALADSKGLLMASAPCSFLSETAQTIGRELRKNVVGPVRVVYAEMDDGMVHKMQFKKWLSTAGVPWPSKDEFEIGCTLEHAGYYVTWLASWFGPATSVTSFASVQVPDKLPGTELNMHSPDFSVACIQFASGVVARLTCSILAPHDHSLTIVGDDGILGTEDSWDYESPVWSKKQFTVRRRTMFTPYKRKHKLAESPYPKPQTQGSQNMDFARGPAELAASIREGRPSRMSNAFSLHVNEIALAIHWARENGWHQEMTTTFDEVAPMDWAR